MPSSQFEVEESPLTPYTASLTSFGAEADGKHVKRAGFVLQGNSGSGFVTLDADTYRIRRKSGFVQKRIVDDDGTDVAWDAYRDYQDLGNVAFRATYVVKNGATETTYTNQTVTFADTDPYQSFNEDGSVGGELVQNLWVQEIHAEYGDIAAWILSGTTIQSDSGNVFLDSSVPSIGLGATGYQSGTGFWVGKSGGAYKLYIGDSSSKQMYWDGSALTAGGFVVGADYIRDLADSFGLASTVTGGNDIRQWVGSTFASRASAVYQLYEDGFLFCKDLVVANGSRSGASGQTGYGYAIDPLFLCHYDGASPFSSDYRGSAIGHKGQVETRGGGVIFRQGIFGKSVQISEATTNLVVNPSAEAASNFSARGTTTVTRDTATYIVGSTSYKNVLGGSLGNDGMNLVMSALANAAHYVSFWATGTGIATLQASTDGTNWNTVTVLFTESIGGTTWSYCGASIAAAQANGSVSLRIRNSVFSITYYIDAVQIEQKAYPSGYCDGSLGDGHSWSGTANASTSARTAATLTYLATGNINLAQGSLSFWYLERGVYQGTPSGFGLRIDASNYFLVNLQGFGSAIKPYTETASAGSAVNAVYNTAVTAGWHHCVVTWATGSIKIYVDGVVGTTVGVYVAPVGTPATIEIGSFNGAGQGNTRLDDLFILPVVLADHEVKSLFYSAAPVLLGISNQEIRLSGTGLGDVFGNASGLFGRAANGTPSFGILNGTVNANLWGGDSESFDAGDFMFGSNKTGKSNLTWDASAGGLYFRVATTKKVSIDTQGTLLIGSDVSAVATTAFAVFSDSITYNGESMIAGDIIIGFNGGADVKYSGGEFNFRFNGAEVAGMQEEGLQTHRAFGHAQSSITVGSGNVDLVDSGLLLTSFLRISSSTGAFSLRGIFSPPLLGQRLIVHNNTANAMTIVDNGSPAAGYDKIRTMTGGNITSTGDAYCEFVYNNTNGRWDLLSLGAGVWT